MCSELWGPLADVGVCSLPGLGTAQCCVLGLVSLPLVHLSTAARTTYKMMAVCSRPQLLAAAYDMHTVCLCPWCICIA